MSIFDRFKKSYKNDVNLEDQSVQLDDVLLSALYAKYCLQVFLTVYPSFDELP